MGDAMITDPDADLVTFTGSVRVGKYIADKAGYKRIVLELGGNDPLIVMEDADLDKAAELAVQGATKNSGQRCTAVKRILVVEKVADEFVEARAGQGQEAESAAIRWIPTTDVGTVIHERAAQSSRSASTMPSRRAPSCCTATTARARSIRPPSSTTCPTTANWCTRRRSARSSRSSAVPNDIAEVIRISNSTAYGLSSGVCTNRLDYITRFVNELEVGTVNVWEVPGYRIEMSPFGGIKDSGLGYKEGVWEAMKSYTNVKTYSLPWPNLNRMRELSVCSHGSQLQCSRSI